MTFVFKGFATHSALITNANNTVSKIGELSTQSRTYSKDIAAYQSTPANSISLFAFSSVKDNAYYVINPTLVDHIIEVVNAVYTKTLTTNGPLFADQIANDLTMAFDNKATDFRVGSIVNDAGRFSPESITWKVLNNTDIGNDNTVTVWLSDPAFQLQYDEYSITVVPPITPLDNFFDKTGLEIENMMKDLTPTVTMNRIQEAKGNYPESFLQTLMFEYIDPLNPAHIVPTYWSVLIYGQAGNNVDIIKDTLAAYVLANSTHTRDDWIKILPDLFKRTEFLMIPFWKNYSIPNRPGLETGIYSPIASIEKSMNFMKMMAASYGEAHIISHSAVMFNPFRSLSIGVVGNPENKGGKFKISDVFGDYLGVPTTHYDYGRMRQATQDWSLILAEMLQVAENMTASSAVPAGMTKTTRNGVLYLVKQFQNINYLVAAKSTLPNQP